MLTIALIFYLNISWIMAVDVTSRETLETYFEWKVGNFFDVSTVNNNYLDSSAFSLGNDKWCLRIFPNGSTNTDSRGFISLFLKTLNPKEEYHVDFTLGLKKPSGSEILSYKTEDVFGPSNVTCGWPRFMQRSTLFSMDDSVSSEGTLTVFCAARILNRSEVLPENTSSNGTGNLSENLKDLYASKRYSDVKLQVKSKEFSAHKNILSSRVADFASMYIPNRVEITDVDSDSFEEFLLFLYTGKLAKVSMQKAMSVYRTAKKYKLSELMEKCARSIAERDLNIRTFYDILDFANLHNDNVLLTALAEYLMKNGKYILLTEKWETFLADNPLQVNKLLLRYVEKKQFGGAGN